MTLKYTRLPTKLFRVNVPLLATYTDFELEVMGSPVQENTKGLISSIDERMCSVSLPLTKIIDIYSSGYPISLIDHNEINEVYEALEEYLCETNSVTPMLNSTVYEDERDVDIDRFASEIFSLNRAGIVGKINDRTSGFDIGIGKMSIPTLTKRAPVRGGTNITDAYRQENTTITPDTTSSYLTHDENKLDPNTVIRKSKIRKRQKLKPSGAHDV